MRSVASLVALALAAMAFLLASQPGWAGGLDVDEVGPRAVGRAGTITVSADDGAAFYVNPAGLARRSGMRVQLGVTLHDGDSSYRPLDPADAPTIANQAGPVTAPALAVITALGPLLVGGAYLETGAVRRELLLPADATNEMIERFPHRYGGTEVDYRQRTVAAGAALRVLPWLGIGVSVTLSQVHLDESRHIWAGMTGRGDRVGDPQFDLALDTEGDGLAPGACLGLLVAPPMLPMELAVSASIARNSALSGRAALRPIDGNGNSQPVLDDPHSRTELASPLILRAGLRYLGERFSLEAGGDVTLYLADAPSWQISGVVVRDSSQASAAITEVPALVDLRDHGALRVAADLELASGFLWLSAGYAYRMGASRIGRYTPGYADMGGHTLALGVESHWNGIGFTIGYSRTLTAATTVDTSQVVIIDPFQASTGDAGQGRYDSARDAFGATLEVAWE